MNLKLLTKGLVLIASLCAAGFLLAHSGLEQLLDSTWIDTHVRGQGMSGEAVFVGMGAMGMAVGLPRQMVCFAGGYAFGFGLGTALSLAASVLSCAAVFTWARLVGRSLVSRRFAARINRIDDFLSLSPLTMTLVIRFLPVGNNLLTNLAAGVSSIPLAPFLVGSALGYVPQTAVFALLGSGIKVDPAWRIGLSVALFVLSALLGMALYRRFRAGRRLGLEVLPDETPVGEAPEE